jgi:S-(hydroxymethyl)glutathione dehydrogenase / alcohol dehydrogenase
MIRAAVLPAPHSPLSVEEAELDDVGPGYIRVRIQASGICHSDTNPIEEVSAPAGWPLVLGHEGTGIVEAIGVDVTTLQVGDRVITTFVASCGKCWFCTRGQTHLCSNSGAGMARQPFKLSSGVRAFGFVGLGTFADAIVSPERNFVKIETSLPPEQVALLGCGVTTGVGAAINSARVPPGSSVAVLGLGGVGQSVVQGARICGAAQIIGIDPVELKRKSALAIGATAALDPTAGDPVEAVKQMTGGRGVDFAFEVAGRGDTAQLGFTMIRRGGTLMIVGAQPPASRPQWAFYEQMRDEKRVIGSLYGSSNVHRDYPQLLAMAESGQLNLAAMVSRTIDLTQVNQGIESLVQGEVVRAVIVNN